MGQFSFDNQGLNTYLLYRMDENQEADQIGLGMIGNNRIPNILPMTVHQIDAERFFRYNISSTVSLQRFLGSILPKKKALEIFRSICDAFLAAEEYLLDGNALVLDPRYIFVDSATGEASLVYLSVEGEQAPSNLPDFFKRLIISIKTDQNEDCSYIATVLNHLNTSDHFSLQEFRKMVHQLETVPVRVQPVQGGSHASTGEKGKKMPPVPAGGASVARVSQKPPANVKKEAQKAKELPRTAVTPQPVANSQPKKEPEVKVPEKEKSVDSGAGFAIPGGGFAIPGGSAVKPVQKKETSKTSAGEENKEEIKLMWLLRNFSGENLAKYRAQKASAEKEQGEKKPTKLVVPGKKKSVTPQVLVLMSMDDAHPFAWVVNQDRFTIGRRKDNDGYLYGVGNYVGREHMVIVRSEGKYYAVDLNSKFGTTLNGVRCEPQALCGPLQDGAVIGLPGISFKVSFRAQ